MFELIHGKKPYVIFFKYSGIRAFVYKFVEKRLRKFECRAVDGILGRYCKGEESLQRIPEDERVGKTKHVRMVEE